MGEKGVGVRVRWGLHDVFWTLYLLAVDSTEIAKVTLSAQDHEVYGRVLWPPAQAALGCRLLAQASV